MFFREPSKRILTLARMYGTRDKNAVIPGDGKALREVGRIVKIDLEAALSYNLGEIVPDFRRVAFGSGVNYQGRTDLPPLKWSSLRYDFAMKEDSDGKEAAYS